MKPKLSIKTATIKNFIQSNYWWGVIAVVIIVIALYSRPSVARTLFTFDVETSWGNIVGYQSHEISPDLDLALNSFGIISREESDHGSRFSGTFHLTNTSGQGVLLGGIVDIFTATIDPDFVPNRVTDDDEFVIVPAQTIEILSSEDSEDDVQVVETLQLTDNSNMAMLGRYLPANESITFRVSFVPYEHDATNKVLLFPASSRQADIERLNNRLDVLLSVLSNAEQQQWLEGDFVTRQYWDKIAAERRADLPKDDAPYLQDEFVRKFKVFVEYHPVETEGIKELELRLEHSMNRASWARAFLQNSGKGE